MKKLVKIMSLALIVMTLCVVMAACFGYPDKITYTVTWENYDGTVLEIDKEVQIGTMPEYNGELPVRAATEDFTYEFTGWTPEITKVSENITYTAVFKETKIHKFYTITWKNYDGTILETDEKVEEGTMPSYDGATPVKEADEVNRYNFKGWTPNVVAAEANAEYTAVFEEIKLNYYTITWLNEDGTVLKTDEKVLENTMPEYTGEVPTKADTEKFAYNFIGWTPEVVVATKNATYTAKFEEVLIIAEGASKGLQYGLALEGYYVTGYYKCTDLDVVISEFYKGIPVVGIYTFAFTYTSITSVVMPDSVRTIGYQAFKGCSDLQKVTFSKNLQRIDDQAFYGDSSLLAIELPDTLNYLGMKAFWGCSKITSLKLSNSLSMISKNAFQNCSALISLKIPEGIETIGNEAFSGCQNLASIEMAKSVSVIGFNAFSGTAWFFAQENGMMYLGNVAYKYKGKLAADTNFEIPEGIVSITEQAFSSSFVGDQLISISLPESLKFIGNKAFYYCSNLATINLPSKLLSIGDYAFEGCEAIKQLNIPATTINIGREAFECCYNIEITVDKNNTIYASNGNCLIEIASKTLVFGNQKSTIPSDGSVIEIGEYAFAYADGITDLVIPQSIKYIGASAFVSCSDLVSLTINEGIISIEANAFAKCRNLATIKLPESLLSIGDQAFYNTKFYNSLPSDSLLYFGKVAYKYKGSLPENGEVIVQDGTTAIADKCFANNRGLKSIVLPESLKKIGASAFQSCTGLTSVKIPDSVVEISGSAFWGCTGITEVTMSKNIANIGRLAFYNTQWFNSFADGIVYFESIAYGYKGTMPENTELVIKDGIKIISEGAFLDCANLISITMPESVEELQNNAFEGCANLKAIDIPKSIKKLGLGVFANCSSLKSITIPEGITELPGSTFLGCSSLETIELPSTLTVIGYRAFGMCNSLTSFIIPDTVVSLGNNVFEECVNLKSVVIPKSVKFIGSDLFLYDIRLENVFFEGETEAEWNKITKGFNVIPVTTTLSYFSATEKAGCWHYVEGKPELWA